MKPGERGLTRVHLQKTSGARTVFPHRFEQVCQAECCDCEMTVLLGNRRERGAAGGLAWYWAQSWLCIPALASVQSSGSVLSVLPCPVQYQPHVKLLLTHTHGPEQSWFYRCLVLHAALHHHVLVQNPLLSAAVSLCPSFAWQPIAQLKNIFLLLLRTSYCYFFLLVTSPQCKTSLP